MNPSILSAFIISSICIVTPTVWGQEIVHLTPESPWFQTLSDTSIRPGTQIVLAEGTYRDARRLAIGCRGTAKQPIVIQAAQGQRVILERPDANQNTLNLDSAEHVVCDGLEITGGSAAIRIGGEPGQTIHGVVVRNCHIHHVGGVAVTCNHPGVHYIGCQFTGNHIHHTGGHGEGFYLGGNDATAIFGDGLIRGNYIHDLNGPDISQGDGIEVKVGSYGNRILNNVIVGTRYPGITVYGSGGKSINRIANNLILQPGDNGIQVAADAAVEHNTIVSAAAAGIAVRKHQGAVPSGLLIQNNVVLGDSGDALRIDWDPADSVGRSIVGRGIVVRHNQLHARSGHSVMRIAAGGPVEVGVNRGSGRGISGDFNQTERIDWSLPKHVHPLVWQQIDPERLRERVWSFASPPQP